MLSSPDALTYSAQTLGSATAEAAGTSPSETDWLGIARMAFDQSTDYLDANYRQTWERDLMLFLSRHPQGSKYHSEAFKNRSKIFRPKTRGAVRKAEAAVAAAFFSNQDILAVDPQNPLDQRQVASAAIMKEILQYRLTKTLPWFLLVCGAFQDASVIGACCSFQYWKRETEDVEVDEPSIDPETGIVSIRKRTVQRVVKDEPCVELIPAENIRIDPASDWMNPIHTSPYVVHLVPMYVVDVKRLMDEPADAPLRFKELSESQMLSATRQQYDPTRLARQGKRDDPTSDTNVALTDYTTVWCHQNFVRRDGQEWVYWTMGTEFLLTEPKPLREVYWTGMRPFEMGCCVIETHKVYPSSQVTLGANLQKEANEIVNQRLDNVKLVLNKRWFAKRGSNVDLRSLLRNVPGSVTLTNDPVADIREVNFPDVTASGYAEQDRLNVDFDEIVGNFSQSSVQTNRQLNETVGGMQMLGGAAAQVTEYAIRTFAETWLERVLRQLVLLEQKYETDQVILNLAAGKANLLQRFGIDQVTDQMLEGELTVNINVGMGSTNPQTKLTKFMMAMNSYVQTIGQAMQAGIPINPEAIAQELFGTLGYKSGAQFFQTEGGDPRLQQMQQQMQQIIQQAQGEIQRLQQELQSKQMDTMARLEAARIDAQTKKDIAVNEVAVERQKLLLEASLEKEKTLLDVQTDREKLYYDYLMRGQDGQLADNGESKIVQLFEKLQGPLKSDQEQMLGHIVQLAQRIEALAQAKPRSARAVKQKDGSWLLESTT